jgi:hypothetical protein
MGIPVLISESWYKRHTWTRQGSEIQGPGYKIGYALLPTTLD